MATSNEIDLSTHWSFFDDVPEKFDFESIFGNSAGVELEIGSGKGLFLVRQGSQRPDVNFLGIELAKKFAHQAAIRIAKRRLSNVRLITADAKLLLPRIGDRSLQAIHVYFPDPWWKRKHRKRRMIDPHFVEQASRVLQAGGELRLATDVEEYFQVMKKVVAAQPSFEPFASPEPQTPEHDLDYLTHFERKYRLLGRSIHRTQYRLAAH